MRIWNIENLHELLEIALYCRTIEWISLPALPTTPILLENIAIEERKQFTYLDSKRGLRFLESRSK